MKTQWLNLVLTLTNQVYTRKQSVIDDTGLAVVGHVIGLFFLEILLAIVSLPLYLGVKPEKVTAYLSEKGGYEKIAFNYNLRRVLTLTGLGVVFFIWAMKLALILLLPNIYGPLPLYQVSGLRPADITEQNLIGAEAKIQSARIMEQMTRPVLTGVKKTGRGDYIFSGTGQAQTQAVLMINDRQTVILVDKVNSQGQWQITQIAKDFKLSEGNHEVAVFSYDEKNGIRSQASAPQYFKVKVSFWDQLINRVDIFVNFTILIIIGVGVLLTVLTL